MLRLYKALVIGILASVIALALWLAGALDGLEGAPWSWRVKSLGRPSPSTDQIKLILVDQPSLDWGEKQNDLPWPWPREVYVPIIDFCARAGAKALAFDVLFTETSGMEFVAQDEALGAAARRAGNFIGAVFLGDDQAKLRAWPDDVARPRIEVSGLEHVSAWNEPGAAFPIRPLATNAALLANVKDIADPDGVFRHGTMLRVFDGVPLPSLGLATYLVADPSPIRVEPGTLQVGEKKIPIDGQGRAILRYRGPSGTHQAFSAASIIQSELDLQAGLKPTVDPANLKDKYVLFGFSAPGLKDLRPTPYSRDYPGVEIHATTLDNLLERDFLRDEKKSTVAVATVLLAIASAFTVLAGRKTWHSIAAIVVFLGVPPAIGFLAYAGGYWWPIVATALPVLLALVSAVVLNYATEGRQKRFIKSAFNQYVGEEVLAEMTRDPSKLRLGGEKKEITMFFSDLEKFSSFSERLDPPQLIELLNVYLTEMGHVIKQETGGYLDKFVGDAIVAFWNGPVAQPDHAVRAVRAAIFCQRRLTEKRDEWAAKYSAVLKMRIGIGTGEVVVGNMGSADKFNYTMLGDAANAASRLEGSNKAFGTYTMCSEVTWAQAKDAVIGRELAAIRVVGRKAPVKVYEPMGLAGESLPAWVADFERAVGLCREAKWKEALAIFEKITDDAPSKIYAQRCRDLASGVLKEWDGVWNLTEK